MPTLINAVIRSSRLFEGYLRSLNELYRQGGPAAETALLLFDRDRLAIMHARAEAEKLLDLEAMHSTVCASFARGGAALINLRLHPSERIQWIEAGIRSVQRAGDQQMKARLLNDLGMCHIRMGEFQSAADCYQLSFDLSTCSDGSGCRQAAMGNLANLYLIQDKPRNAIELLDQVVSLSRQRGNERQEANALNSLGAAYKNLGEYVRSIEYCSKARLIHNKIGDHRGEGTALINLGVSYHKSGDSQRAIGHYDEALVILRAVHDESGESDALWNMSLALHEIGRFEDAVDCAKSALAIRERLGDWRAGKIRKRLKHWKARSSG